MLLKENSCSVIRGLVDLKSLALRLDSYAATQLQHLEALQRKIYGLPEEQQIEAKKRWNPKMGLGQMTIDCLGAQLDKEGSARWRGKVRRFEITKTPVKAR